MNTIPMGSSAEQRAQIDRIAADPNAHVAWLRALRATGCKHRRTMFSRVLCGCGAMHTYCLDCDMTLDSACLAET